MTYRAIVAMAAAVFLSALSAQTTEHSIQAELLTTVKAKKAKAGDVVRARAVNNTPLPDGTTLTSGTILLGTVRAVEPNAISLAFDGIEAGGKKKPLVLSLRAAMLPGGSESEPKSSQQVLAHSGTVIGMPGVALEIDESAQHASRFVSDRKDLQLKQGLQLMLAVVP